MMKKFNKILIIIAIILVFLGATLLIFKQNKKDDDIPNEESLINFNISNDIEHETSFISNNTYLVVVLKNNSNTNIIKANLKVNFTSEEVNEEIIQKKRIPVKSIAKAVKKAPGTAKRKFLLSKERRI